MKRWWQQSQGLCELSKKLLLPPAFQPAALISLFSISSVIISFFLSTSTESYHISNKIIQLNSPRINAAAFFAGSVTINNSKRGSAFARLARPLLSRSATFESLQSWREATTFYKRSPIMASQPTSLLTSSAHTATTTTEQHQHQQCQKQQSLKTVVFARLISASVDSLKECGERLRNGHLVSFPTETVYGLGCHALDPHAVAKVYAAKERPFTDPLIVHVCESSQALPLWDVGNNCSDNEEEQERLHILNLLCRTFWPGPLTIVAPANVDRVPQTIMANTSYVAIRYPSHPIAQLLIQFAGVPIAAPSANKFGHVSPTRAEHVMSDLGMEDVWVIDPALNDNTSNNSLTDQMDESSPYLSPPPHVHVCQVGVESTVIKVDFATRTIEILRHGAVSQVDLESCISHDAELGGSNQRKGLENGTTTAVSDITTSAYVSRYLVIDNIEKKNSASLKKINDDYTSNGDDDASVSHVAPGQSIRHYSPNVLSYMISPCRYKALSAVRDEEPQSLLLTKEEMTQLSKSVIIDFGGKLKSFESYCLDYQDLSATGNAREGASRVFEVLRWSEMIKGAERVYFPQLSLRNNAAQEMMSLEDNEGGGLLLALKDRLTRAASGVVVDTFQ